MVQMCKSDCCPDLQDTLSPEFFKALCDKNRLVLLERLAHCRGSLSVSEIACCCPVDLSVVSRHLRVLRAAGIVTAERKGKEVHYRLETNKLVASLRAIADAIEACCGTEKRDEDEEAE